MTGSYSNSSNKMPQAFITVNKNRQKIYNNYDIYLKDKSEFEIEIFNPLQETIGIIFEINGKRISNNHLILKPGQRFYLDRYINDNKKFLYTTYDIDNINSIQELVEVKEAIQNNGSVDIYFYKEIDKNKYDLYINHIQPYNNKAYSWDNGLFTNDIHKDNGLFTNDIHKDNILNDNMSNNKHIRRFFSNKITNDNITNYSSEIPESIETGMIGEGKESQQKFESINIDIEQIWFHSIKFRLSPESNKPIEPKDFIRYCTNCGTKSKKEHKFCSQCGTEI
jgi:hypothetical protein